MLNLSIQKIIEKIENEETFEAIAQDGSFYLKIEEYVPFVCAAIHHGNKLREELKPKINLFRQERWYEEDPCTGDFIESLPIVIKGLDSRFEYDLNRTPEECIYDTAWGKKVWKTPLTDLEKKLSLEKYNNFYLVINKLILTLENKYNSCLIYDIHSYNYKRYTQEYPVFNLGTKNIDSEKFGKYIQHWLQQLEEINLPNIETTVKTNDIFQGNGNFLVHITNKFKNSLVFATEIKKIYCDEKTGIIFPVVIEALKENLKEAILSTSICFTNDLTPLKIEKKQKLLSRGFDDAIQDVDMQLFRLVKDFEILSLVNPINLEEEKEKFFANGCANRNPDFRYRQISINPYSFKQKLFNIPVDDIRDIDIQKLYKEVINSFADKIDMISSIGTQEFLYNSLRYFGEPNEQDIANAQFLMHLPELIQKQDEVPYTIEEVEKEIRETVDFYGFNCKIDISDNITASAQVINSKKTLILKRNARYSSYDAKILANHEIGVHMVTTINARLQPLRVFQIGLPLNTLTQEGLAVLSEYLSGSLNSHRLKELGIRSLAIRHMLKGNDFRKTFMYLVEEHNFDQTSAFYLTARIFRGGGFTKDYLYLRGFRDMVKFYKSKRNLAPMLIGKTSYQYEGIINEMIDRKLAVPPRHVTKVFQMPVENNPILDYIIDGIK